uniref:Metalloprotease TIKI n=1 Tax=Ciona savignyi TaxID=51511 RepID=H2Y5B0_CIOSA
MTSWVTSKQVEQGLTARLMYNELVGGWERKRPIWIMLMINALTKPDIRSRGLPVLDVYLARQAELMGKRTGAIEKVEEQCRPFNGLNMSQVLFALNHTLTLQEKIRRGKMRLPYSTDDLINTYNCGDLNSLIFGKGTSQIPHLKNSDVENNETGHKLSGVEITTADTAMASEIDEYLKEELIFRRNERMATRVVDLIRRNEDESFFFAFGAGHFLGNGSVIDYVTKAGFEIERVDGEFDPRSDTQSGLTSLKGSWGRGKNKRKHREKQSRFDIPL